MIHHLRPSNLNPAWKVGAKNFSPLLLFVAVVVTISSHRLPVEAADRIDYRLKWLFNASVAGDLYADARGHFRAYDLEVTVKEGGPERDAIRELELGHADFGVASADQVIRAMEKGAPVVVLAQFFQENPLQWIYRASKPPVETLSDLKKRRIGVTFGGNDETIMRTLLARAKLKNGDTEFFSVRYDYTPFYQDKVDLWPVYRNAQGPIIAEKLRDAGEDVRFFNPSDFGVKFVANSLVTSEKTMLQRPKTVERFVKALLEGWEAALDPENAAMALKTVAMFDKDTPPAILEKQLELTRPMVKPTPDFKIGTIDVAAWKETEKIMIDQKQIEKPVFVEKALRPLIP